MLNFIAFLGGVAFTLCIVAIGIFMLKISFFQKYSVIKKITPYLIKRHKYVGIAAILLATAHGLGMLYELRENLFKGLVFSGVAVLAMLWIVGSMAFTMKRIEPKKKMLFLKLHKYFGVSILILVAIHLAF